MMLLIGAMILGWIVLSVPLALGCGRAFASGWTEPDRATRREDLELVA